MPCVPLLDRDGRRIGTLTLDPVIPPPSRRGRLFNEGCEASKRRGMLDWMAFAEAMSVTHVQRKCRLCGRFHLWKRKPRARRRR